MAGSRAERGGLAFAVPETDAVGVSMECDRGSRSVRISTVDDRIYAVAKVPADNAALQAFRASGKMWVWDDNQFMRAETLAERQAIEDFFRFCGAR
ncbi:hypothetical protein [Candidatus Viadribacter manganicus]|nr:hypothetical protein [Candidatus Viadribacter manganicus]